MAFPYDRDVGLQARGDLDDAVRVHSARRLQDRLSDGKGERALRSP